MEVVEDDDDWVRVKKNLKVLVNENPRQNVVVQVLLSSDHLPPSYKSNKMSSDQVLQTNLIATVDLDKIITASRLVPAALYQFGGIPTDTEEDPRCMAFDRYVVGHMQFKLEGNLCDFGRVSLALLILRSLHGQSGMSVKAILQRVTPFHSSLALPTIARNLQLFGFPRPGFTPYVHFIFTSLTAFARGKAKMTNNTKADNTLHLNVPGPVVATILQELIKWGQSFKQSDNVFLTEGILKVTLPDFPSAKGLLGCDSGLFDFNEYELGFVELFAPITVKWEMFDTTRSLANSRAVDGFVAITFSHYITRDRNNDSEIRSTKRHKQSRGQLNQAPAKCL